jgi:hypothetical protein
VPAQKNALKPWQYKQWCIPEGSAEFVACMEDVLDLYAEPYDPRRIRRKLEFHFTPKHGSWLNMAEIELSVLHRQGLDRRLPEVATSLATSLPMRSGAMVSTRRLTGA